jgi:hypothetical protein
MGLKSLTVTFLNGRNSDISIWWTHWGDSKSGVSVMAALTLAVRRILLGRLRSRLSQYTVSPRVCRYQKRPIGRAVRVVRLAYSWSPARPRRA